MQLLNRTAVTIVGAKPFLEWTRQTESDANRGTLTVARAKTYGTAFLLPELESEIAIQEWIEDNAQWLFEFQLSSWTEEESTWPPVRDLKTFREWFRIDVHNIVVDAADSDLEGEEF